MCSLFPTGSTLIFAIVIVLLLLTLVGIPVAMVCMIIDSKNKKGIIIYVAMDAAKPNILYIFIGFRLYQSSKTWVCKTVFGQSTSNQEGLVTQTSRMYNYVQHTIMY